MTESLYKAMCEGDPKPTPPKFKTMELWFYKGKGNFYDKLIRWWNHSRFSHVELHIDGTCYSSSPRDDGVRSKVIKSSDNWVRVPIAWADEKRINYAKDIYRHTASFPYDRRGIIWSQIFSASYHKKNAFFCSEWCATALMIEPSLISPQQLYDLVISINVLTSIPTPGN